MSQHITWVGRWEGTWLASCLCGREHRSHTEEDVKEWARTHGSETPELVGVA